MRQPEMLVLILHIPKGYANAFHAFAENSADVAAP